MDADANILLTKYGEPRLTIDDMAMPADAGGDARGEHNPAPVQRVGPVENPLQVILAADDVLLREGLAILLERAGFDVVGQADDRAQLLALVRQHTPDLVVTDIRMPPTNTTEGLDASRVIRVEFPDAPILACRTSTPTPIR